MGHPKFKLLASNGAPFCHAIYQHSKVMLNGVTLERTQDAPRRGRHGMHQGFLGTQIQWLCLNIHTHWKVSNVKVSKVIECFAQIHMSCSFTASCTLPNCPQLAAS